MNQFDRVVLTRDLPEFGLKSGDIGTIVHVHDGGSGFEVEFFNAAGDTVAVATLEAAEVRAPTPDEILHVRPS
jgi:hypothetical protein